MLSLPSLTVRNYCPETDAASVRVNLEASGAYVEEQDNPKRLAELVGRLPTAVLVVVAENPAQYGNEVFGNAYAPDCTIPLICRVSLSPNIPTPEEQFEVARVLYNGIFNVLRKRNHSYAEELLDIPHQDGLATREPFLSGLGFTQLWGDMRSMTRRIKDEGGNPLPDIPPLNPLGDNRSLDVLALRT